MAFRPEADSRVHEHSLPLPSPPLGGARRRRRCGRRRIARPPPSPRRLRPARSCPPQTRPSCSSPSRRPSRPGCRARRRDGPPRAARSPHAVGASTGGGSDLSLQNLVTGSHTLRVFYGGPEQQRVALLGQLSESDVIHNGTDLWTYSSSTRAVTHATLPGRRRQPGRPPRLASRHDAAGRRREGAGRHRPDHTVQVDRTPTGRRPVRLPGGADAQGRRR